MIWELGKVNRQSEREHILYCNAPEAQGALCSQRVTKNSTTVHVESIICEYICVYVSVYAEQLKKNINSQSNIYKETINSLQSYIHKKFK